VADAHFVTFASHALLRALSETLADVPASPMDMERAVRRCAMDGPPPEGDSATTLLLVVLRYDMRAGFGFSWGDSTCASVGGRHDGRALNFHNDAYVNPAVPWTLGAGSASFFEFELPEEGLVAAFTDGINGCHYRHPESRWGRRTWWRRSRRWGRSRRRTSSAWGAGRHGRPPRRAGQPGDRGGGDVATAGC
jgi:hypothetical protein